MGVRNLWDILESCKTTLPLQHLQNKRVCVDLSCWVIQLQNASKSTGMAKEKVYLKNFFHRLRALIALNCSLIFVADGSIPSIKLPTYRQRLGSGDEGARAESNSQRACSHPRNMGSEFSSMIKEAKILGLTLGIPCLDGLEEAEAQCALLNSESLCDGCFSADSDVFLFGARTVYRDIYLGEGGYVVCYEMADIERKLGFGRNSLISLAILLGSDYSQGVHGIGQETACRIVKSVGDNLILHRIASEGLAFAKTMKVSKKQQQVDNHTRSKETGLDHKQNISESTQNPVPDDQFMQVIDAYLKPKCHSPDSAAVLRLFVPHPFEHSKLQQICEQFFGWNPEKTDEYILPKIAERELRRFANLRFVSSELGVLLPLHEMPITCPVSAIIKERKVQGRECFEVSWEKIDGLKTSIVPASLVESACPEKIAEFMERKAEGKQKKKSKPKKPRDIAAPLSEIDLRLQALLLDAESPRNNFPNSPKLPEILQTGMVESTHDMWNRTINQPLETEVIDLCTPLPPLRACEVSKCQQPIQQKIHVINLSDSENEVSPEHEKRARELRLFIASVKDDIS